MSAGDHPVSLRRDGYLLSTERALIDAGAVHAYLRRSYWSPGIRREIVERAMAGSLCYAVHDERASPRALAGFGRVITDGATFAYICDVFVLENHRGRGLSKWLVETMLANPGLARVRRWLLATRDAHGLYARFGFMPVPGERWMERVNAADAWSEPAPGV